MKRLVIELDDKTHQELKQMAVIKMASMRFIVGGIIQQFIDIEKKRKGKSK